MSSKSKVIIGIVLLAVGTGLVPTGLVSNDYLRERVYNGVPEAMINIKNEALPGLMDAIPPLATPDVLKGFKEEAIVGVEPVINILATPQVLRKVNESASTDLVPILNGTVDFLEQWANGTHVSGGIDLHLLDNDIPNGTYGLEAGIPTPTNIPLLKCVDLWNDSIALTFVNDDGIKIWVEAAGNATLQTLLSTTFNITSTQLALLLGWLNNFINNLTPVLVEAEPGPTINELATLAFYEQWANGTISGEVFLLNGLLGEFNSSYAGAPFFEVGLPNATSLTLTECLDLWDETGINTFINRDSFANHWLPAIEGDTSNITYLEGAFGISTNQVEDITEWLSALIYLTDPSAGRIADLLEYELDMSLTEIATLAVYEQWSNGTIYENDVLPDGLLSERKSPISGPPYFEVSLTVYSLQLNDAQVQALWDRESEYSLVTKSGIQNWYKAENGNTIYETLRLANKGLAWWQMYAILEWIPQFRDKIVNKLEKDDMNLPMEPYALGETLSVSLGITGAVLAALGVVFLLLSRRS
jgi:hypothetical protein